MVTGSASGIGRGVAVALAEAGAVVHLHTRANQADLEEVRGTLSSLRGGGTDTMIDLASPDGCIELIESAWQAAPVDIWVNNAGVDVLTGDAAGWPFEQKLAALWQVDVRATMLLTREVGQRMIQRGSGAIINIGWDQANSGMEGDSGEMFAAAKGAVMAFTRSAAQSLAPKVRVNCIAPGWIRTKWSGEASDYWDRRARGEALLERWGTVDDVAAAALFLASPASSFVTGHVLPVNGGFAGSYRGD